MYCGLDGKCYEVAHTPASLMTVRTKLSHSHYANTTDYHFISFFLGKKDGHIIVFNRLKFDIVLFAFVKNKGIRWKFDPFVIKY